MSYAVATISGRLVADPEVRTAKDKKFISFRVAVDGYGKDAPSDFWSCTSSSERDIENIVKFFKKGRPITVTGTPSLDTWEGTQSKMSSLALRVQGWGFVDKDSSDASTSAPTSPAPAGAASSDKPF